MNAGTEASFSFTVRLWKGFKMDARAQATAPGITRPTLPCSSADIPERAVVPRVKAAKEAAPCLSVLRKVAPLEYGTTFSE